MGTKKSGNFPKNPHEIGRSGKQFEGGKFGEKRGSTKSWTDKLRSPK